MTIDVEYRRSREGLIQAPSVSVRNGFRGVDGSLMRSFRCPPSRIHKNSIAFSLRKEVIQPQVLLRLPCYDFTPIMNYTLEGCPLAVGSPASSATHFRDVTGGVYKARERIHRSILICDY